MQSFPKQTAGRIRAVTQFIRWLMTKHLFSLEADEGGLRHTISPPRLGDKLKEQQALQPAWLLSHFT